jgi:uncharacterized membrane protein
MERNPYAPPTDDTRPGPTGQGDDGFIENGRSVSASRGSAWLTEGWDIVKGNVGSWILICILYLAIVLALAFIIPRVGPAIISVIAPVLTGGLLIGCRDTQEAREFGVGHLFEGFKKPGGLLAIGGIHLAWQVAIGGVGLLMGGGGMFNEPPKFNPALGLPAFMAQMQPLLAFSAITGLIGIPVSMATFYAPALVALRDMSPLAALTNSFLGAAKNIVPYIVYAIVLFLFSIAAALPCGLGLLVLVPVIFASIYVSYRDVFFDNPTPA